METVDCFCSFSPKKLSKLTSIKQKTKPGSNSSSPRNSKSSSHTMSPPRNPSVFGGGRSREDELREVFRHFDGDDCNGKISAEKLRCYFASVGEYMSYEEAQTIVVHLDSDKDNLIDFEDFVRFMEDDNSRGKDDGGQLEQDLKGAFQIFELEKGSGRITPKSLQRVLGKLGNSKSYYECVDMIRVFDTNDSGEIGYDEFRQMMMPQNKQNIKKVDMVSSDGNLCPIKSIPPNLFKINELDSIKSTPPNLFKINELDSSIYFKWT